MKKSKIIGVCILVVILVGLFIFAGTFKLTDSHLRVDGIRVRVEEGALYVSDCVYGDAAHCTMMMDVQGEDQTLEFEFLNFKENGYPDAVQASINGHVIYYEDGLNIEENSTLDYRSFMNFYVIDDVIAFTLTKGMNSRSTTLFAVDTEGNILLEETEIDDDNMLIKDYSADFVTYEDNVIRLYGTRIEGNINYHGESVCHADDDEVVEAYYTYTYEDGKFTKELDEEITAEEFIELAQITCAEEE